jgi:uncharacterized phage protein (TIGR01671 family)
MNREIKFRAWNGKNMVDLKAITPFALDKSFNLDGLFIPFSEDYKLMQFTGLTDNKGKEIYEGDILRVGENLTCEIIYINKNSQDWGDELHASFHAEVFKHNKIIPIDSYFIDNCKVIGNIFENPESINK